MTPIITWAVNMFPIVESSHPGVRIGMFFSFAASTHECSGGIW